MTLLQFFTNGGRDFPRIILASLPIFPVTLGCKPFEFLEKSVADYRQVALVSGCSGHERRY
jgi:hypothetical protein